MMKNYLQIAEKPIEGKCFIVDLSRINRKIFYQRRKDPKQEGLRNLICIALEAADKNTKRYGRFITFLPKKEWSACTVKQLCMIANRMGDHLADWIEQALEWAQRISNGETWELLCNDLDESNWLRIILWKDGYYKTVGGSSKHGIISAPIDLCSATLFDGYIMRYTVPNVVLYDVN